MTRASETADRSMDELDESTAVAFERLLQAEPEVPAGLVARMQVRVAQARRAAPLVTPCQRVVIGATVFSLMAYAGTPATLVASLVVATLYALAAERSRASVRERSVD